MQATPYGYHPSPQFRRSSWQLLDGSWDFYAGTEACPTDFPRQIAVPYCPESRLSGIGMRFPAGTHFAYRRYFSLPEEAMGRRIVLHFGAVDQKAECYVNQKLVGSHVGGYTAFALDISDAAQRDNELVVLVTDELSDRTMPHGKQSENPGGMWYTPVTGIWQSVWVEWMPRDCVRSLSIHADSQRAVLDIGDGAAFGTVTICTPEGTLTLPLENGVADFAPERPRLWCPEDPYLYECTLRVGEDIVHSYFALRSLEVRKLNGIPRLCLNGKPRFFHGLLDQGYWDSGLYTPPSVQSIRQELEAVRRMGFNTLRKHMKIEPEEYYYQCDRLGLFVFQDMVPGGDYDYVRDTVLPTLGLQRRNDRSSHPESAEREQFLRSMEETVGQLKNHPSIVLWTIFNEGWGQFDSTSVYRRLKALDSSRFVCTASGWFRGGESDVYSRHIYFGQWFQLRKTGKPLILDEFGGICLAVPGHLYSPDKSYGYSTVNDTAQFRKKLLVLYRRHILPAISHGLCAAIYTQVSDVEEEINGLLTYDRMVTKPDEAEMALLAQELYAQMEAASS